MEKAKIMVAQTHNPEFYFTKEFEDFFKLGALKRFDQLINEENGVLVGKDDGNQSQDNLFVNKGKF
jgi:hypothetical protein